MHHSIFHYINPNFIIKTFGIIWVLAVIFSETWLLVGILLPGDSLLFLAWVLVSNHFLNINIYIFWLLITLASIIGNQVWYFTGKKLGKNIYKIPENILFKHRYLDQAKEFYDKYGKMAIIVWKFVPIVRTIVPIFAGAFEVSITDFMIYNVIWSAIWVSIFLWAGYVLGNEFPSIWKNVDLVWVVIVLVSVIPIVYKYISNTYFKKNSK